MDLDFNMEAAKGYKSNSQIARVTTEEWVKENSYCPSCGNSFLKKIKNNEPVADFVCPSCSRIFELKSKNGKIGNIINDGAYNTLIEKISDRTNPDFLFLSYSKEQNAVNDFFIIPGHFFTPNIVIKRKPLSENARRAGWIGCNINIGAVPDYGRIYIIKNQFCQSPDNVIKLFNRTKFLGEETIYGRGWIIDVMSCINRIQEKEFSLSDVYKFENELKIIHPDNNNIKAKIRQQLQLLRDRNIIGFVGKGRYVKI